MSKDRELDLGDMTITIKEDSVQEFLVENFDWGDIYDAFYYDVDEHHNSQCFDCSDKCDIDYCDYVSSLKTAKNDLDVARTKTTPYEIALDFHRDDSYIMDIFKELKTDELTTILKRIGYEQPHICTCKKSKD